MLKAKHFYYFLGFLGVFLAAALAPECAFAQAQGSTLGSVIDNISMDSLTLRGVFAGFAYMMGLIMGYTAILKLKDHVEKPQQVELMDAVKRFIAGGMFFALPFVIDVVRETIEEAGEDYTNSGFNGSATGLGLDAMIVKLMTDVFVPLQYAFGVFGYLAGIILVIIGISRLLQTEQQGPKGPTGIGTIMTFLMAGCLFSLNSIITYITTTMFDNGEIATNGTLAYAQNLGGASAHVHAVISAVIAFAIVVGWVSLIRGIFILRGVSEGSGQASMMAAITHIIGGVLAINLGSVINAVQTTLGITQYGLTFD
jgi:hypothetical protein